MTETSRPGFVRSLFGTPWKQALLFLLAGFILTGALSWAVTLKGEEILRWKFRSIAADRASLISSDLENNLRDLDSVRRFLQFSGPADREDFCRFVAPILKRGEFRSLAWVPAPSKGKPLRISWVESAEKPGTVSLGEEPASGPVTGEFFRRIRDEGILGSIVRRHPSEEADTAFRILFFLPVYGRSGMPSTPRERSKALRGYLVGDLRPEDWIRDTIAKTSPQGTVIRLLDLADPSGSRLLCCHFPRLGPKTPSKNPDLLYAQDISLPDRILRIELRPNEAFVALHRDETPRILLLAGALLTILSTLYLHSLSTRHWKAEALAERRAEELREKTEKLNRYFSGSPDLLCVIERGGTLRDLNPAWGPVLGYGSSPPEGENLLDLIHPEDRTLAREILADLERHEGQMSLVCRCAEKDGTYRRIDWRFVRSGGRTCGSGREIRGTDRPEPSGGP